MFGPPRHFSAELELRHRLRSEWWLDTSLPQMIPTGWNELVCCPWNHSVLPAADRRLVQPHNLAAFLIRLAETQLPCFS
jgi:hypothetical protein